MNNETNDLLEAYRDAVRLYMWYSPSEFSCIQGKASKELAAKYRAMAHKLFAEYVESKTR